MATWTQALEAIRNSFRPPKLESLEQDRIDTHEQQGKDLAEYVALVNRLATKDDVRGDAMKRLKALHQQFNPGNSLEDVAIAVAEELTFKGIEAEVGKFSKAQQDAEAKLSLHNAEIARVEAEHRKTMEKLAAARDDLSAAARKARMDAAGLREPLKRRDAIRAWLPTIYGSNAAPGPKPAPVAYEPADLREARLEVEALKDECTRSPSAENLKAKSEANIRYEKVHQKYNPPKPAPPMAACGPSETEHPTAIAVARAPRPGRN